MCIVYWIDKPPNPAQQKPYMKATRDGKTVDINGKQVESKSAESHA